MIIRALAWLLARPRVTDWLIRRAKRRPYTHIVMDGDTYMERYWLFNPYPAESSGNSNWFPISVRLHWIRRPDPDRNMHDHPWNARTFILRGGYVESRQGARRMYRLPGDSVALKFGEYHRIDHVLPRGAWTLFVTGKYRGTWGFLMRDGTKMPWREYLGEDKKP